MNNLNIPYGWKILKISELFDFLPTGSHSRDDMTFSTNQDSIYNIHYGDLHTKYNGYVDFDHDKVPALKKNDYRNEMLLQNGDLVVVDASEDYEGVGTAVELKNLRAKKCIAGLHTFAFRDKVKYTVDGYRSLLFQNPSTRRKMMLVSTYSKVFGITKSSISDIKVILPTTTEQHRIVSILETWDEYLELLDKKIALKEQLKKGLVQQLLAGKKRIPGFHNLWEAVEFNDIFEILKKPNGLKSEDYNLEGKLPIIDQAKDKIISGYTNNESYGHDFSADPVTVFGDHSRVVKYINQEVAFGNDGIKVFRARCGVDSLFANYLLAAYRIPETGYNRHFKYISDAEFELPDLDEQKSIVDILGTIDAIVEQLKQAKIYLTDQKKYLLNNLITGKMLTPENLLMKGVN